MAEHTDRIIEALRSGHDALASLARDFTPDGLALRSGAADWDVSQVMSHLGSGAEIGLATLERALSGAGPADPDFNKTVWARWDAMTRAERAESSVHADEALVRRYEKLGSGTRENLRIDAGFLPQPVDVATYAGLRLNELTLHSWDIAVAKDPAATLAPAAVDLLLDQAGLLIGRLGRPEALHGQRAELAVHLTNPTRTLGLALHPDAAARLTPEPARPEGVLTAPAEWWLRLLAGRHAAARTPDTVRLTSDTLALDDLRRVFPGY